MTTIIDSGKQKRSALEIGGASIVFNKKLSKLEGSDCPVFKSSCLGPACTAYEIAKETSYYDREKKQWIGLAVVLDLSLEKNQERVEKHVVILHGCRYQNVVLLSQASKSFKVPRSLEESL